MSFTPDNKEIVTTRDGKLHRVAIDDGNVNVIPLDVDPELEEYKAILLVAWRLVRTIGDRYIVKPYAILADIYFTE